jgi:hypothetical protein
MIKFVKFVDVTDSINACNHCHYGCNGTRDANNCGHWNECAGGHFVNKPPTQQRARPRKSRDRRLLEALLKQINVSTWKDGSFSVSKIESEKLFEMTRNQSKQLLAIKQAMDKKGGK